MAKAKPEELLERAERTARRELAATLGKLQRAIDKAAAKGVTGSGPTARDVLGVTRDGYYRALEATQR